MFVGLLSTQLSIFLSLPPIGPTYRDNGALSEALRRQVQV